MEKKINHSLNVVKALAVFAVIYIHAGVNVGVIGTSIYSLTGFAVPLFFLISGFYSYFDDIHKSVEKYKSRIFRLIKLIFISNGLYLLLSLLNNTHNIQDIFSMFSPKSCLLYLVFTGTPIATHLWFLQALLFCYFIVFLMCRYNKTPDKLYIYIFRYLSQFK